MTVGGGIHIANPAHEIGGEMSFIIFKKGASKIPRVNKFHAIVKIQRYLDGSNKVLVYNKSQSFVDEFMGFSKHLKGDLKGYFKVTIKNGNMRIIKRVEDRNW
jgi:hypothetical protein